MITATAPVPAASHAALSIVYEDVQEVLNITVAGFCRKYPGDYEDRRSKADLIFVQQAPAYARALAEGKTTSTLETWLRYATWFQLLDEVRAKHCQKRKPATGGWVTLDEVGDVADADAAPNIEKVTAGMSEDAAMLAALAIDTPPTLQAEIAARGGTPRNHLSVYRAHLMKSHGWSSERVAAAIAEVKNSGGTTTVSRRGRAGD